MTHASGASVDAAEVAVTGGTLSTDGILSEYARLKQIANARVELRDGVVHPTEDSGKLPVLLDRLDTYGIRRVTPSLLRTTKP